jgi:hypothetical protein
VWIAVVCGLAGQDVRPDANDLTGVGDAALELMFGHSALLVR